MTYFIFLLSVCVVVGVVGVAANPAPMYGALGLVVAAAGGCGFMVGLGASFIGVVLFLIYLGGMLVVFAYSVALAAEAYPETWVDYSVLVYALGYCVLVVVGWEIMEVGYVGGGVMGMDFAGLSGLRGDVGGVMLLYSVGGGMLLLCGYSLLLALFVVFELVRGVGFGSLRVP
uniref:NADH-ubiquinone oxidoreductase chain 6 n=1 Tax=Ptyodactylus guttatus TaxID=502503 RepID=A0A1Y1CC30_9SAUR|nr:NADH dehydrogenase subunit 6 [Ptyodactylus guttatus]BAX77908.1 NADH dehydrogenase subunit 6 [Ptyodactylus guttatus]